MLSTWYHCSLMPTYVYTLYYYSGLDYNASLQQQRVHSFSLEGCCILFLVRRNTAFAWMAWLRLQVYQICDLSKSRSQYIDIVRCKAHQISKFLFCWNSALISTFSIKESKLNFCDFSHFSFLPSFSLILEFGWIQKYQNSHLD